MKVLNLLLYLVIFLLNHLDYYGGKIRVRFSGSCLKQEKITYTHGIIVNTYIVSELNES